MTSPTPPCRRWFRFSLRTLFVLVTIICVWLGWNVHLVQQRKAVRAEILRSGGAFFNSPPIGEPHDWADAQEWRTVQDNDGSSLSFIRRMLGDAEVLQIEFPRFATIQDLEAASVFSEAHVMAYSRLAVPDSEHNEETEELSELR